MLPTKLEVEAKRQGEQYRLACVEGLDTIFAAFPFIQRTDANVRLIHEICDTFLGVQAGEVAPSLDTFKSAVEADPALIEGKGRGLSIESTESQKLKVIAEIGVLLKNARNAHDIHTVTHSLRTKTLEEVRARKAQILERQRLEPKTANAIRAELAAQRPAQSKYHPYETMPPITAPELTTILKSPQARAWLRRFGAAQLNDKLFGRI